MSNEQTKQALEALLFYKNEPVTFSWLAKTLNMPENILRDIVEELRVEFGERGLRIVLTEDTIALRSAPAFSELIEQLSREELEKDIGKAGLETLAIVLYHGPTSRAEIDFIRGVNASYIVRHLLSRGLIEKTRHPNDSRKYLYKPTTELLAHLGISHVSELPNYDEIRARLTELEQAYREQEEHA